MKAILLTMCSLVGFEGTAVIIILVVMRQKKRIRQTGAFRNTDALMRSFLYFVPEPKEKILQRLEINNAREKYLTQFSPVSSKLTFAQKYSGEPLRSYRVELTEGKGGCWLKLIQIDAIGKLMLPWYMNEWAAQRLHAVPVEWV